MENTEILKAVAELRQAVDSKVQDFITKDKVERIVEDVVKRLHPESTSRSIPPVDAAQINQRAELFKNSPMNHKSAPWTSDFGKQFGDMKGYILALKGGKAYVGNTEGTAGDGGNVVPTEFLNTVIDLLNEKARIFQHANVLPMSSWKRDIPSGATNPTVAWVTEAAAKTVVKPTFGKVSQQAKVLATIIEATDELLRDSAIDLQNFFGLLVAEAIGLEYERVALVGQVAGDGDPFDGIYYKSGVTAVTMAGSTLDFDDFIDLAYGGSEAYADGAEIATSRTGLKTIMKLKNGEGQYIWQPPVGGNPANILGIPYWISSKIPTNLSTNHTAALFGNFKKYLLLSPREEMRLLVSQHAYDPTNQISAFFNDITFMRFTAAASIDVAYAGAFRKLMFK